MKPIPGLIVLWCAAAVVPTSAEDVKPSVLPERSARWEAELPLGDAEENFGAEANPTGSPIGGGKGYRDILTSGDHTARTLAELRAALEKAEPGQTVFIPGDAQIDMSGQPALVLPARVTVASTRGLQGSDGALFFSSISRTRDMFVTDGECVRVTGLRIRGPHPHTARVAINSDGIRVSHFGLEVDNCELSGFSHAAIYAVRGASRVYVHHNFIHRNQQSGLGYGVCINEADVLIEANIFDACRHHIAATGAPGCGYEARYNICRLRATGHLFDMHGGRDRGDGTNIAGDWMNIHHNTFMSKVRSVVIRGVPSQSARIHHNWFHHPTPRNAVSTGGSTRTYRNVFGPERKLIE